MNERGRPEEYPTGDSPEMIKQIEKAAGIGDLALHQMDLRYGHGSPKEKTFHGPYHGVTVSRNSVVLGKVWDLSKRDLAVTDGAAKTHDIIQDEGRGVDERLSAEWFVEKATEAGLDEEAIEGGKLGIEGTEPLYNERGMIIGQRISEFEFSSQRSHDIAHSIAAGDFGELLKPEGVLLSHELFRELDGKGFDEEPDMTKLLEFQKYQTELVETFQFAHPDAEVLATHRQEVTAFHNDILRMTERGEITSWGQLVRLDREFMRRMED